MSSNSVTSESDEVLRSEWVVGVTGASGARYALRLLSVLPDYIQHVHLVVSESALRVLAEEDGIQVSGSSLTYEKLCGRHVDNVTIYNPRDIGARIASGSMVCKGMVIIPCSMSTLGAIAHGVHSHLIHRAADVTLKEGRRLIVVPRETPLSLIHLENMATLARSGARIIPAMPGFYHRPTTLQEVVDMMVLKVLDTMGIPNSLVPRWKQPKV
jgi:4-hydroxy-3-polyprenylbenzoate decarboxylase